MPKKNPAAVALGRLGGIAKSEAKAKAARKNAERPRPRKWTLHAKGLLDQLEKFLGPVETWDDPMGVQFSTFVDISGLTPEVCGKEFMRRAAARKKRGSLPKGKKR